MRSARAGAAGLLPWGCGFCGFAENRAGWGSAAADALRMVADFRRGGAQAAVISWQLAVTQQAGHGARSPVAGDPGRLAPAPVLGDRLPWARHQGRAVSPSRQRSRSTCRHRIARAWGSPLHWQASVGMVESSKKKLLISRA